MEFNTLSLVGTDGEVVRVQSWLNRGLNRFAITGLGDRAIRESVDRIKPALLSLSGFLYPYGNLVLNLSPAGLEKFGTHFDLSMALAAVSASNAVVLNQDNEEQLKQIIFLGELDLNGRLSCSYNLLPYILEAVRLGFKCVFIPVSFKLLPEITDILNSKIELVLVESLQDCLSRLKNQNLNSQPQFSISSDINKSSTDRSQNLDILSWHELDIDEQIYLQQIASNPMLARVLQIAAVGKHNLLLDGSPGVGKSSALLHFNLLRRPLVSSELLETAKISALSKSRDYNLHRLKLRLVPQRNPHHSLSLVALLGGGSRPEPGEISLAHRGVLFLDEITEFPRDVLESLRQPLEVKTVNIARAKYKVSFPADFQLVATRNPCPCGYLFSSDQDCSCTTRQIQSYQDKLSGPILNRIDIKYRLSQLRQPVDKNLYSISGQKFWKNLTDIHSFRYNRQLDCFYTKKPEIFTDTDVFIENIAASKDAKVQFNWLLSKQGKRSWRQLKKIISLSRTIADCEFSDTIILDHVTEAVLLNNSI